MAYQCECCGDLEDGDPHAQVVIRCSFELNTSEDGVVVVDADYEGWCEICVDDYAFYCEYTDEYFSESRFDVVRDANDNLVAKDVVQLLKYVHDKSTNQWRPPNEEEEQAMATSPYIDFYWELRDGERHGVLQRDGGDEEKMSGSLEKKIAHRIKEAGADGGDPQVVNVYTRLELIEQNLLPADYTL